MCEANVYILKDGNEELFMEDVDVIQPEEDKFFLRNVRGDQKMINAKIKSVSLVNHKIVLEKKG